MLKRIALFVLAHMAFFGVAAALVAASTSQSGAQVEAVSGYAPIVAVESSVRGQ